MVHVSGSGNVVIVNDGGTIGYPHTSRNVITVNDNGSTSIRIDNKCNINMERKPWDTVADEMKDIFSEMEDIFKTMKNDEERSVGDGKSSNRKKISSVRIENGILKSIHNGSVRRGDHIIRSKCKPMNDRCQKCGKISKRRQRAFKQRETLQKNAKTKS